MRVIMKKTEKMTNVYILCELFVQDIYFILLNQGNKLNILTFPTLFSLFTH